jgi:hypothetical protein
MVNKATPGMIALWNSRLKVLGLSADRAMAMKGGKNFVLMGDFQMIAAGEDNGDAGSINTAGVTGTDHDFARGDSSVRDRRATGIRKKKAERVPGPLGTRCRYCGLYFAHRKKGAKDCCDEHHDLYKKLGPNLDPVAKIIIRRS